MNTEYHATGQKGVKMVAGEELFSMDEITVRIIDRINKTPQQLTPLARAAVDARGVLNDSLSNIGAVMEEFDANTKKLLSELRTGRMAVVAEVSQIVEPLKELRKFFIGADYEKEMTRLKEFVELCERLQKLKQSGFLDSVADTMLNLSEKP